MISDEQLDARKPGKTERLLKITAALLYSKRGLSREELFTAIPEYHSGGSIDAESAMRKFEHDKVDLRDIGIKIDTVQHEDQEEVRYVIAPNNFSWPKNTRLSAHQLQLLDLAAAAWSQASLAHDVDVAITKLRALGITPAESDLIGVAPAIRTWEPSFAPLLAAIESAQVVKFKYQKPLAEPTLREVEPWQLKNFNGNWMLISFDRVEKSVRNFLLKRIKSPVSTIGPASNPLTFERPSQNDLEHALKELERHSNTQTATFRVRKDSAAWFAFQVQSNNEWEEISLNFMDAALLAEQLISYMPGLEVIEPAALKSLIQTSLERVRADHA